jgi:hypothetical protein
MKKQPLNYQSVTTRREPPPPQVRFQTIVSCSLLGLAVLCGLAALLWHHRRAELFAAAISFAGAGVIVHLPFRRM